VSKPFSKFFGKIRGSTMVEIRTLAGGNPGESNWVVIRKRGDSYIISAKGEGGPVEDSPAAFKTAEAAIHTATKWADLIAAQAIYIQEASDPPPK
jgi:hypothetical protein